MSFHDDFFGELGERPNGKALQAAYKAYKADCYMMNAWLKGESPEPGTETKTMVETLEGIICGRNKTDLTLWRVCPSDEFKKWIELAAGSSFTYPAYMSTCDSKRSLHQFAKAHELVVMKILCPAGTPMALMEANEDGMGLEREYLLGRDTTFEVLGIGALDNSKLEDVLGQRVTTQNAVLFQLKVVGDPEYTNDVKGFWFDPSRTDE